MDILRTPEERFAGLAGYAFEPRYEQIDGLRIHCVDEGPRDGPCVVLLHGEPSWSYLYRRMIPLFVAAGFRAVAPDLVGFGRSDKPARRGEYTYARHVGWMAALLKARGVRSATLLCQDWGGLIGLRLAAEDDGLFAKIVAANTSLPTGAGHTPRAFKVWSAFSRFSPIFPIGRIVARGCVHPLTLAERAAYDAPFPSARFKAGARQLPSLVPTRPDQEGAADNRRAWEALRAWKKPFLTAFSTRDPITRGADTWLQKQIPGAQGQPHTHLHKAGHFLQEDAGDELARVVISFAR